MKLWSDPQHLIALVQGRNAALSRVLKLSTEFAQVSPDTLNESLVDFERKRERAISKYQFLDQKISSTIPLIPATALNEAQRSELAALLKASEELLKQIIIQDQLIQEKIITTMSLLQSIAKKERNSQERLKKFKSGWLPDLGESLDKTV